MFDSLTRLVPFIAFIPLLLPLIHPLLIPVFGVASHLLWFSHAASTAVVTFNYGRKGALIIIVMSLAMVVAGERAFGNDYGSPAEWATVFALGTSTLFVNLLMVGFGLYARQITQRYQILFKELTIGVIRLDSAHKIVAINPEASRIFDLPDDQLLGLDINEILSDDVPDLKEMETMQSWNGRIRVGKTDEQLERYVLMVALALSHPHRVQLLVVDRTIEEAQEREIERQSKLSSLGEALAGVAHELKSPLQVISGYAELATHVDQSPETMRDNFIKVKEQSDRMRDMAQDLLGYSRQDEEVGETVEIGELINDIVSMEKIALGKHFSLNKDIKWDGSVVANKGRIEQILLNLISNAGDSIREKGGSTITVTTSANEEWLEISVQDDGVGISEDIIEKVFEPFATTKEKGKGTGLGLAISQRFARSMDGELVAGNTQEGGAIFTLKLPLERG